MKYMKTIVALFADLRHAQRGVEALHRSDVASSRIGLLVRAPESMADLPDALDLVRGVVSLPPIGRVLAMGPLHALIMSGRARAGASASHSVSALLVAAGLPESEALRYEAAVRDGNVLVMATVGIGKMERVARELARCEAVADVAA
jgi:hypothetical protein